MNFDDIYWYHVWVTFLLSFGSGWMLSYWFQRAYWYRLFNELGDGWREVSKSDQLLLNQVIVYHREEIEIWRQRLAEEVKKNHDAMEKWRAEAERAQKTSSRGGVTFEP